MKKVKALSLFLILVLGFNFTDTVAVSYGFDPITIYTQDCNIDEEQVVFFDILVQVDDSILLASMNEMYLTVYQDGDNYDYHDSEEYTSYLAYYPEAEFVSINCYFTAYTFLDSDISEYKLIAFDIDGNTLTISELFNIDDIGYQDSKETVKYYEYDYDNNLFNIIEDEVEESGFGQTIDFVGSFILGIAIYFVMAFVGILPFMINSKKHHKEAYIETMLAGNALIFLALLFLFNLEQNGLLVFGIISLIYILSMLIVFKILNKKYNPTYKLFDITYILLAYGCLVVLTILILK